MLKKGMINDEIIKNRMSGWYSGNINETEADKGEFAGISHKSVIPPVANEIPSLNEESIMIDILNFPGSKITERYERLKLNKRQGNMTKNRLIMKGYAEKKLITTSRGWFLLLNLTQKFSPY